MGNLDNMGYIHHGVLREATDTEEMVHCFSFQVPKPAGSVPRHVMDQLLPELGACVAFWALTISAFPTIREEHWHHHVPFFNLFHILPYTLHNSVVIIKSQ